MYEFLCLGRWEACFTRALRVILKFTCGFWLFLFCVILRCLIIFCGVFVVRCNVDELFGIVSFFWFIFVIGKEKGWGFLNDEMWSFCDNFCCFFGNMEIKSCNTFQFFSPNFVCHQ